MKNNDQCKTPSFLEKYSKKIGYVMVFVAFSSAVGFNIEVLRWAWFTEHQALSAEVEEVRTIVYANECVTIEKSLGYYLDLKEGYIQRSEDIPDRIIKRINELKNLKKKYNCP